MLVEFVLANRRRKAFVGWGPVDIAEALVQAGQERTLLYATDGNEITGVVHGNIYRQSKTIYVCNVLTTRKGVLQSFIKRFAVLWPGYKLEARRHDRIKHYDTPRLVQKLLPR